VVSSATVAGSVERSIATCGTSGSIARMNRLEVKLAKAAMVSTRRTVAGTAVPELMAPRP
jgi:hypothetical protein